MTWLARWKDTGRTTPAPPKAVFYCLLPLFALPVLAAIAIPSYQNYLARAQVSEGLYAADSAKTAVAEYIGRTGQVPASNAEAGLGEPQTLHGKYVSSVEVVAGTVHVTYGDAGTRSIRGRSLDFTPEKNAGQVTWRCSSVDLRPGYLPAACR